MTRRARFRTDKGNDAIDDSAEGDDEVDDVAFGGAVIGCDGLSFHELS